MRTSENFQVLKTELLSQMGSLGEEIAAVSDALQERGTPEDTDPERSDSESGVSKYNGGLTNWELYPPVYQL